MTSQPMLTVSTGPGLCVFDGHHYSNVANTAEGRKSLWAIAAWLNRLPGLGPTGLLPSPAQAAGRAGACQSLYVPVTRKVSLTSETKAGRA